MKAAIYSTFFEGFLPFLPDFMASVAAQTHKDVDLVIALDGLSVELFRDYQHWRGLRLLAAPAGSSPAEVRLWAWRQILAEYEAIIFCDGDDILEPQRVSNALASLQGADIDACGLTLVDAALQPLGITITPTPSHVESLLYGNSFGLSNTAYTTKALKRLLDFPASIATVDWYLITKAQSLGLSIRPRADIDMLYRQHGRNIASPTKPFSAEKIFTATSLVLAHLEAVLNGDFLAPSPRRLYEKRLAEVKNFQHTLSEHKDLLNSYLLTYNKTATETVWWNSVAPPQLRHLWQQT